MATLCLPRIFGHHVTHFSGRGAFPGGFVGQARYRRAARCEKQGRGGPEHAHTFMRHGPMIVVKRGNQRRLSLHPLVSWVMQRYEQGPSVSMERWHHLDLSPHNHSTPHSTFWATLGVGCARERLQLVSVILECPFQSTPGTGGVESKGKTLRVWKGHALSLTPALQPPRLQRTRGLRAALWGWESHLTSKNLGPGSLGWWPPAVLEWTLAV